MIGTIDKAREREDAAHHEAEPPCRRRPRGGRRTAASVSLPDMPIFLTALAASVVSWRRIDGARRYYAVRRCVRSVSDGTLVAIATREAVAGDDLDHLEQMVLAGFRDSIEAERAA